MSRTGPATPGRAIHVPEQARRDAVIAAWVQLSVRDRQLAVLRLNHPHWSIHEAGGIWWAEPSWLLTIEQVAAGVPKKLERENPVALMADLSTQAEILRSLVQGRS